jgi:hypothetical protein
VVISRDYRKKLRSWGRNGSLKVGDRARTRALFLDSFPLSFKLLECGETQRQGKE